MPRYLIKEAFVRYHEVNADDPEEAKNLLLYDLEAINDNIEFAATAQALGFEEEPLNIIEEFPDA